MDLEQKSAAETPAPKDSKRTEKALVVLAVLLLLFSAGALYFDDWLWSGLRSRSDSIGMITSRSGDVRLKFDQEVSWQKANTGQSLQYNDSIFAGKNSEADIKLGESQLTVTQNSLVVLRREMDANFLNLSFGTLFGKVAKNEKVYIDTGAGKPTLLKTNSEAQIVLKKTSEGKTSLEVIKGVAEVEINGVKKTLSENTQLELPSKPEEKVVEKKLEIKILPPSPMDTIYSKDPQELHFKWSYGDLKELQRSDRFQIEFSKESNFLTSLKKHTQGETQLILNVAQSNQLYYRVKGPHGEMSPTYRFGFVRLLTPEIVSPLKDQIFETGYRQNKEVPFSVKTGPLKPRVWTQIAADPEFKTVLVNESQQENVWEKNLPAGAYFLRARSDYGANRLSDWSATTNFRIKEDRPKAKIPVANLDREVTIRNLAYPGNLYGSSDQEVQNYLWENGFLRDYFRDLSGHYDQLSLDFGDGEVRSVKDAALPKEKIYPSTVKYRYQLQKAGQLPSRWSPQESVRINLEPPKENFVEIVGEQVKDDGKVPVKVDFTPVLFAKSYDFQIATHPSFLKAQHLKGAQTQRNLKLALNKDYYWRVRALNAQGKPISGYSGAKKLSSKQLVNQVRLAKNKIEKARKPAAVEAQSETRSQLNQMRYTHQDKNFWAWLGSGFSFVNYQQSIDERGTLDSSSRNDKPGQYFEIGYIGDSGYGGVLGYKSTPGEVVVENAALDNSAYVWRTISLEGLMLKTAKFKLFGLPINYGPRIGVQSHNIPYIFLNASNSLELKQNNMLTASAGVMADVPFERWKFHTYMRYQFPISAESGGASDFELTPKFAFDGLLGSSYYFSQNFKVGAFWYGQWHFYDFIYADTSVTNSGSQSLFYSTMDIRFGFEF